MEMSKFGRKCFQNHQRSSSFKISALFNWSTRTGKPFFFPQEPSEKLFSWLSKTWLLVAVRGQKRSMLKELSVQNVLSNNIRVEWKNYNIFPLCKSVVQKHLNIRTFYWSYVILKFYEDRILVFICYKPFGSIWRRLTSLNISPIILITNCNSLWYFKHLDMENIPFFLVFSNHAIFKSLKKKLNPE